MSITPPKFYNSKSHCCYRGHDKHYRIEICDKLIHKLITAGSMMKLHGEVQILYRAVSTSMVGQFQPDHFLGVPKRSCTHYYWHHHQQASWQLCVQLSSFKIDPKLAANRVKAYFPDKVHHPKQSTFPSELLGKPNS